MIKVNVEDNISIVTISNGKTNSVTVETLKKLGDAIQKVNDDDALKGIVLTGEGKFFSSGFDLPMFMAFKTMDEIREFFRFEEEILLALFNCNKPVVCAMNGHSAAMGMIMAMASDYRIIANHPKIKIGMSEIKIGLPLSPAQAGIMRFGLDSDRQFRDVMYFGKMVGVSRALAMDLVDEVVDAVDLISRAKEIITLWIDTPNRPFIPMKKRLKKKVTEDISKDLADGNWEETLSCFFKAEVRSALEFVMSTMPS